LAAAGRAAILVPYPLATGDHQTHNARMLVGASGANLVEDQSLFEVSLLGEALGLLGDRARLEAMGHAALALGRPDAAERIASAVIELCE
jgi:UDP-N-acetylglucosamine--N-acetylmuramyl-(pentapeptide) pyrophosphoryl-undecaprenol N-acetylglucosamine transferase